MLGRFLLGLGQWWHRYKYRFVPWVALNLSHNPRTLRYVPEAFKDKVISDEDVLGTLLKVFQALFLNDFDKQVAILTVLPELVQSKYQDLLSGQRPRVELLENRHLQNKPEDILYKTLGFSVARATSSLMSAGRGVFVTKGLVTKGAVVSMYPGTVYQKYEPIFFQSIGNPFIFRCLDGILIDGNDKGISRLVYRSCNGRDRLGPFKMSDSTWLTSETQNPLAVGQYVNNCSNDRPANVCYQEFDLPTVFPVELKQYLPNIAYSWDGQRKDLSLLRKFINCNKIAYLQCEATEESMAPCAVLSLSHSGTSDKEKSFSQTTIQLSADSECKIRFSTQYGANLKVFVSQVSEFHLSSTSS